MPLLQTSFQAKAIEKLRLAVHAKENVQGLTHNYYRYPARFSPKFVDRVIKLFSRPGDVILDPFVGGGTTLVEAFANGRYSIGFDVSPIATFVSNIKTTLLTEDDFTAIRQWLNFTVPNSRIRGIKVIPTYYHEEGYLNNLPWNISLILQVFLSEVETLSTENQKNFVKCALLRTAQWAVDCKKKNPSSASFRKRLSFTIESFITGNQELNKKIKNKDLSRPVIINNSSQSILQYEELNHLPKPKLVITSPPYIGVHMLYHQWQVNSRKRTRTPFWIINSLDGQGSSFYTFGHYQSHAKKTYFDVARNTFTSIHSAIDDNALVVQLVGFSNHKKFLKKYLTMMSDAGYEEIPILTDTMLRTKRIWRKVPNRKWYVTSKNQSSSSKEVLLLHRKK